MKIIVITTPKVTNKDTNIIKALLDGGVDIIHLRKPNSHIDKCRKILETLDDDYRAKIVIHNYPELYTEYSLKGIHQNRIITTLPEGYNGLKTRSCHTFEEVVQHKGNCDYLLLSPIFNSISKEGYTSKFTHDALIQATKEGVIDERVIALGGITFDKINYLRDLKFGGVAMLGAIYNMHAPSLLKAYINHR